MLTCTHKFYSTKDFSGAWENGVEPEFVSVTCGSTEESFDLLKRKVGTSSKTKMICIDVANGYREVFQNLLKG